MKKLFLVLAWIMLSSATLADGLKINNKDEATVYAAKLIGEYELTRSKVECLAFEIEPDQSRTLFTVRVRENHKQKCGGDPAFAPTLFFMQIRKRDGMATTDAYDGDAFIPISEAARKIAARRAKEKKHQQPSNKRAQK